MPQNRRQKSYSNSIRQLSSTAELGFGWCWTSAPWLWYCNVSVLTETSYKTYTRDSTSSRENLEAGGTSVLGFSGWAINKNIMGPLRNESFTWWPKRLSTPSMDRSTVAVREKKQLVYFALLCDKKVPEFRSRDTKTCKIHLTTLTRCKPAECEIS